LDGHGGRKGAEKKRSPTKEKKKRSSTASSYSVYNPEAWFRKGNARKRHLTDAEVTGGKKRKERWSQKW